MLMESLKKLFCKGRTIITIAGQLETEWGHLVRCVAGSEPQMDDGKDFFDTITEPFAIFHIVKHIFLVQ